MSNRSERRAAERAALKAARSAAQAHTQNPFNHNTPSNTNAAEHLNNFNDPNFNNHGSEDTSTQSQTPFFPRPVPSQISPALREQLMSPYDPRNLGLHNLVLICADENQADYQDLIQQVYEEFNPQTGTEYRLANAIVQHYWFVQRAIRRQENLVFSDNYDPKRLALFERYQAVNERSYYRAIKELQRLQKERQKQQIGFESQNRDQESHDARVRLAHAKAQKLEIDTACRQVMEAPLPGNFKISFQQLANACSLAIATVVAEERQRADEEQLKSEPEQTTEASA